jgi:phage terminase large subunit-like protein
MPGDPASGVAEPPDWVAALSDDPAFAFVARHWTRAAAWPGAWFDADLAEAAVTVWPAWFRHTEGRWAGKPFHLVPWQAAIVRLLVGWRAADGFRLFRRLFLWIGRKNGKTEFLAALAVLFWLCDREMGGQAYAMARNENQARLVFGKAKTMIRLSPAFVERVQAFKKSLYCAELWARFEVLSGAAEGKHGLSASVIVGDEMHEWPDGALYTTLHQSIAARDQPIELYGSTAGFTAKGYGWTLWQEGQAIAAGSLDDPTPLVAIFAAEPQDDWTDEAVWTKANPNLGISPKIEYLRAECAKARDNPRLENDFRRYHLNQWTEQVVRWLSMPRWEACAPDPHAWRRAPAELRGRRCFGGLDLSSVADLTALVWVFPPEGAETRWRLVVRLWCPAASIALRARRDRVPYDLWARDGALSPTDGDVVDYAAIERQVKADAESFDVQGLAIDRWNATGTAIRLAEDGCTVVMFGQGFASMSAPAKEWERLVMAGLLDHGGHPVLRWMAGHVAIKTDDAGNIKPTKQRSAERIDGVVAGIMGLGLAIGQEPGMDIDAFLEAPLWA